MILRIFTVYDQQAKAHHAPFFMPETGMAIRAFSDMVNNPESQFGKHPEDYTLHELGHFDDTDCIWEIFDTPVVHGTGIKYTQASN